MNDVLPIQKVMECLCVNDLPNIVDASLDSDKWEGKDDSNFEVNLDHCLAFYKYLASLMKLLHIVTEISVQIENIRRGYLVVAVSKRKGAITKGALCKGKIN